MALALTGTSQAFCVIINPRPKDIEKWGSSSDRTSPGNHATARASLQSGGRAVGRTDLEAPGGVAPGAGPQKTSVQDLQAVR